MCKHVFSSLKWQKLGSLSNFEIITFQNVMNFPLPLIPFAKVDSTAANINISSKTSKTLLDESFWPQFGPLSDEGS